MTLPMKPRPFSRNEDTLGALGTVQVQDHPVEETELAGRLGREQTPSSSTRVFRRSGLVDSSRPLDRFDSTGPLLSPLGSRVLDGHTCPDCESSDPRTDRLPSSVGGTPQTPGLVTVLPVSSDTWVLFVPGCRDPDDDSWTGSHMAQMGP